MRVVPVADLAEFAALAEPWLARDPLRNNVITTVMSSRLSGLVPAESDLLLLRVEDDEGMLAGVAIRTPPQAMLLCEMSPPATAALLEFLHRHAPEITAFNGPASVTAQVASAVAARTGGHAHLHRGLGRYVLQQVIPPAAPPGRARQAILTEVSLLDHWLRGFHADIGSRSSPDTTIEPRVTRGLIWVWDTGETAVAMAGTTSPADGLVRINLVYTPPKRRGQGLASALVAHVGQRILDRGHVPMLFTDLGNRTSNGIYQAIGFRKLDEAAHWQVVEQQ